MHDTVAVVLQPHVCHGNGAWWLCGSSLLLSRSQLFYRLKAQKGPTKQPEGLETVMTYICIQPQPQSPRIAGARVIRAGSVLGLDMKAQRLSGFGLEELNVG